MSTPLTKEQTAFADKHHNLIYSFLKDKKYPQNEFFGIAAIGYIRAVRTYSEREDLREAYAFSTIAYWCMRSDVSNHFRAEKSQMRYADTRPYDEDADTDRYVDSVWESVMHNCAAQMAREKLQEVITPRQRKLAMLRADGYSDREIGRRYGIRPSYVAREIESAGDAIRNQAPELLDLIAA